MTSIKGRIATLALFSGLAAPAMAQEKPADPAAEGKSTPSKTMTLQELEPIIRGNLTAVEIFSATSAQATPRDNNLYLASSFQPVPERLVQGPPGFVSELIRIAFSGPDVEEVRPDMASLGEVLTPLFREFDSDYTDGKLPPGEKPAGMSHDQWLFNHHMQRFADKVQADHSITVTVIVSRTPVNTPQLQTLKP